MGRWTEEKSFGVSSGKKVAQQESQAEMRVTKHQKGRKSRGEKNERREVIYTPQNIKEGDTICCSSDRRKDKIGSQKIS